MAKIERLGDQGVLAAAAELRYIRPVDADLAKLFPSSVVGCALTQPSDAEPLYPEEEAAVVKAVEKRRVEFALGRTCARRALRGLGIEGSALPANPDRSVGWPQGVVGSISHAEGLCVAVCARREQLAGLGVDVEQNGRVCARLWQQIAGPEELAWLGQVDEESARQRATLLFSAKEAFYKAQFCLTRAWVGFHDAQFRLDGDRDFELLLLRDVGGVLRAGMRFRGKATVFGGHVVTGVVISPAFA